MTKVLQRSERDFGSLLVTEVTEIEWDDGSRTLVDRWTTQPLLIDPAIAIIRRRQGLQRARDLIDAYRQGRAHIRPGQ